MAVPLMVGPCLFQYWLMTEIMVLQQANMVVPRLAALWSARGWTQAASVLETNSSPQKLESTEFKPIAGTELGSGSMEDVQ
mmetsp:Transcript_63425/g.159954  ORF Transcript_63425/g.159954 Transcript_63425/m.159954 type:complete len:81 (-) Transcript_63425:81-323(-)